MDGLNYEFKSEICNDLEGIHDKEEVKRICIDPFLNLTQKWTDFEGDKSEIDDLISYLGDQIVNKNGKNREKSLEILITIPKMSENVTKIMSTCIPAFDSVFLRSRAIQVSEEERLLQLKLLSSIVKTCDKNSAHEYQEQILELLKTAFLNSYHEVLIESCYCLELMLKKFEIFGMCSKYSSLYIYVCKLLSNKRSKVRLASVHCLGEIAFYCKDNLCEIIKCITQRLFDSSFSVRLVVARVGAKFLCSTKDFHSFNCELIPLILALCHDEIKEVRVEVMQLWSQVGEVYESNFESKNYDIDLMEYPRNDIFTSRPRVGCRNIVKANFSNLLNGVLNDLNDWIDNVKVMAANFLWTLIIHQEYDTTQYSSRILYSLIKSAKEECHELILAVEKCAELIGHFVPDKVWTEIVLQKIKCSSGVAPTIKILACILRTSKSKISNENLLKICEVLSNEDICFCGDEMAGDTLKCFFELYHCYEHCKSLKLGLIYGISSIIALNHNLQTQGEELVNKLSKEIDEQDIYGILKRLTRNYLQWTSVSKEIIVLDFFMRKYPISKEYLSLILPIFKETINGLGDPQLVIEIYFLLTNIFLKYSDDGLPYFFDEFFGIIVDDILLKNIEWRNGKTATALRTATVSCLWAFLKIVNKNSGSVTLFKIKEYVLGIIKKIPELFEDDSEKTRKISCMIITLIIRHFYDKYPELHDSWLQIYSQLLERMDDPNNSVRSQAIVAIDTFFEVIPPSKAKQFDKHAKNIFSCLLLHLNDDDNDIRELLAETIKKVSKNWNEILEKEIFNLKNNLCTSFYFDELISCLPK